MLIYGHAAAVGGAGYHHTRAFNAKGAVDSKPKWSLLLLSLVVVGLASKMCKQRIETTRVLNGCDKTCAVLQEGVLQQTVNFCSALLQPFICHSVGFGNYYAALG